MFRRRGVDRRYTQQQTVHWLTWLARQMVRHSQTVFYIEQLQPDWLPGEKRWVFGLVGGLVYELVGGLVYGLVDGLVVGLVILVTEGFSAGEIETRDIPNQGIHRSAWNARVFGLFVALFGWLGLFGGLVGGLVYGLVDGLVAGLLGALFGLR